MNTTLLPPPQPSRSTMGCTMDARSGDWCSLPSDQLVGRVQSTKVETKVREVRFDEALVKGSALSTFSVRNLMDVSPEADR